MNFLKGLFIIFCLFIFFILYYLKILGAEQQGFNNFYSIEKIFKRKNLVPIVIIGSGPAGLMAAVYSARERMHTVVIEGYEFGGLLAQTDRVDNWPGSISLSGNSIVETLKSQAVLFGAHFLSDEVKTVNLDVWPFEIKTVNGSVINALSLIIATGAKPRLLGIQGEDEFWGRGISSCAVCDGYFFQKKNVAVVGGGDSAMEEAIHLSSFAEQVTILVRSDKLRAAVAMQERIAHYKNIRLVYNVEILEVFGDKLGMTGLKIKNNRTNVESIESFEGLFIAIGHIPNTGLFEKTTLIDEDGYIIMSDRTQGTVITGVFAAGDVEDRKYRQAGIAAGNGIKAALDALSFLHDIGFNHSIATEASALFFEV